LKIKDLGELHYCLGLEVWREDGKTLVTQSKYTKECLRMFNMNEWKVMSMPLEKNDKLYSDDEKT
jgi:hypothetical protein